MRRTFCLILAMLLLALSACSSGGGVTTGLGLTPLDFDVTTDPGSTPQSDGVIGYAVERVNPLYAEAEAAVPAGSKLASVLQFGPETPQGAGFSGDFTVRTENRAVSSFSYGKIVYVYVRQKDADGTAKWIRARRNSWGSGGASNGRSVFRFRLDFLGTIMILEPVGNQFLAAAFTDVASSPINTDIQFWAVSSGGDAPIRYSWSFGNGATAVGQEVTHSYPLIGEYTATCTVTDADGDVAEAASTPISIVANPVLLDSVWVIVTPPAAGQDEFGLSATVNGGSIPFEYEWDLDGDGTVDDDTSGANLSVTPAPGLYVFELVVTDQTGAQASTSGVLDARKLNLTGGTLTGDPLFGYAPQPSHFVVTTQGTTVQDTISIDYGDGNSETVIDQIDYTFDLTGVFTVVATLSRDVPGFGTISKQSDPIVVTIDSRPDPHIDSVTPARAQVGEDVTLAGEFFFGQEAGDTVTLNGLDMSIVSWTPTEVVVTVPVGAVDGAVVLHKWFPPRDSNDGPLDVAPTTPGPPGLGQL